MEFSSRTCFAFLALANLFFIAWFFKFNFYPPVHNPPALTKQNSSRVYKQNEESNVHDIIRKRINESEIIWKQKVLIRNNTKMDRSRGYMMIWDFFYQQFDCPHEIKRIGRAGDGGKWVCGVSHLLKKKKSCVVYSYGVGGDSSFEEDILSQTSCTLRAFDQTVDPGNVIVTKKYPTRSWFYQIGLGSNDSGKIRTLKTEMKIHGNNFIDILKTDIEGGEFNGFRQALKDFPNGLPFGQLLIEIHIDKSYQDKLFPELKFWWESLENAGLRPFNREANPSCDGCFEYSFLNVRMNHTLLRS